MKVAERSLSGSAGSSPYATRVAHIAWQGDHVRARREQAAGVRDHDRVVVDVRHPCFRVRSSIDSDRRQVTYLVPGEIQLDLVTDLLDRADGDGKLLAA